MSHWSETKDRISKGALQWRGFSCHQGSIDKEEQASACLESDASSLSHPAAVRSFGETEAFLSWLAWTKGFSLLFQCLRQVQVLNMWGFNGISVFQPGVHETISDITKWQCKVQGCQCRGFSFTWSAFLWGASSFSSGFVDSKGLQCLGDFVGKKHFQMSGSIQAGGLSTGSGQTAVRGASWTSSGFPQV